MLFFLWRDVQRSAGVPVVLFIEARSVHIQGANGAGRRLPPELLPEADSTLAEQIGEFRACGNYAALEITTENVVRPFFFFSFFLACTPTARHVIDVHYIFTRFAPFLAVSEIACPRKRRKGHEQFKIRVK